MAERTPRDTLIVANMRTGSTFLVSALGAHPNVYAFDGEICFPGSPWMSDGDAYEDALSSYYDDSPAHEDQIKVAKITYAQLNPLTLDWIEHRKMPVIHLIRKNFFLWAYSAFQDQATKDPRYNHFFDGMEEPPPPRFSVLPRRWIAWMDHCWQIQRLNRFLLQRAGVDMIDISYEQITHNKHEVASLYGPIAEQICEFIGIAFSEPLETRRRKSARWPIKEVIENWDEVYRVLKGSKYSRMIEAAL